MIASINKRYAREFSILGICRISKARKEVVISFNFYRYFSIMGALAYNQLRVPEGFEILYPSSWANLTFTRSTSCSVSLFKILKLKWRVCYPTMLFGLARIIPTLEPPKLDAQSTCSIQGSPTRMGASTPACLWFDLLGEVHSMRKLASVCALMEGHKW